MGALKSDSAGRGARGAPERGELDSTGPAGTAMPAALDRSPLALSRVSAAGSVQALTLTLLGALIVAGLVTGISALFFLAIGIAPTGDALASWLRRRARSKLGAG